MNNASPVVSLGDLLIKSSEWIDILPDQRYQQVTVRLWGQGVVQRNVVTGADIAASKRLMVRSQQFIVSRIDARNGAFGLIPNSLDGAVVSNDFPVFTPDAARILPAYLAWLSKTPAFVELCKAASEGTTNRVRLKEELFLAAKITLPPLDEQQRIVARIEELATKIEEAQGLRRKALEGGMSFVSSFHLQLSKERVVKLGDVLVLDECREEVRLGHKYPQVGVKGFGQGLFAKDTLEAGQTTYRVFNRLYDGAIVLSQVKGWEGAIAVCDEKLEGLYVSPEYRTFRCIPGQALPEYLSVLFAAPWFWQQLQHLTRGMGGRRERVRPELFLNFELPMPNAAQQEKAVAVFGKMSVLKRLQAATQAELDALLPAVLDKVFNGKL